MQKLVRVMRESSGGELNSFLSNGWVVKNITVSKGYKGEEVVDYIIQKDDAGNYNLKSENNIHLINVDKFAEDIVNALIKSKIVIDDLNE